jgi:hypothetical protein
MPTTSARVIRAFIALDQPKRFLARHTTMPGFPRPPVAAGDRDLSEAEGTFRELQRHREQARAVTTGSRRRAPQTLADGLHDSPVGQAAWIVEKWRAWTDPDGELARHFTKDERLTHVTIYWATQTANAAGRAYSERARDPRLVWPEARIRLPTGVALSTECVQRAPRQWVERRYPDIRRWPEFPCGGHVRALQEPDRLVVALRAFFRPFR